MVTFASRVRGVLPQLSQMQFETSLGHRSFSDKTEEPKADANAATDAQEQEEGAAAASKPEEETVLTREEQLTKESAQLHEQVKDLKNQLLRSLAEQENTRSIAKRDVQQGKDFAIKSFAKSLLDVSDNLSRALQAVPKETLEQPIDEESPTSSSLSVLKTLYEGIDMTDKGLTKAFFMNGLTKYAEEPGDVFNPEQHEALFEYPDPDKEPGTIGQVMKVGFMLNKRVLRPAEVGIVKKP
jgi:molecular chaperone GrpE